MFVTGCIYGYGTPACSPLGCVTACVVYGRFDSKIRFERKKRFAGPYFILVINGNFSRICYRSRDIYG